MDDGHGIERLRLLGLGHRGRVRCEVAATAPDDPAWTDGTTVFVDRRRRAESQVTAARRCRPRCWRPAASRPRSSRKLRTSRNATRRYLAIEGHRALAANEAYLPWAVRAAHRPGRGVERRRHRRFTRESRSGGRRSAGRRRASGRSGPVELLAAVERSEAAIERSTPRIAREPSPSLPELGGRPTTTRTIPAHRAAALEPGRRRGSGGPAAPAPASHRRASAAVAVRPARTRRHACGRARPGRQRLAVS